MTRRKQCLTAIDLFSGAGGVTAGYKQAGVRVVAAVELDEVACASYRLNHPEVALFQRDIKGLTAAELSRTLKGRSLDILTACSPCQSFSSLQRNGRSGRDADLVLAVVRFVRVLRPRVVVIENVPRLAKDDRFHTLTESLASLGYNLWWDVLDASKFGVPQRRKRLVVIGVLGGPPRRPRRSSVERSVRWAFKGLNRRDALHVNRLLPPHIAKRVRAIPLGGGSRAALPTSLALDCHKRLSAAAATNIYGRMRWGAPAPTLTTRCTTPSSGRFLHPQAQRAITLREAARLQSFPRSYSFAGTRFDIERQIGNAVPVELARRIAVAARLSIASSSPHGR